MEAQANKALMKKLRLLVDMAKPNEISFNFNKPSKDPYPLVISGRHGHRRGQSIDIKLAKKSQLFCLVPTVGDYIAVSSFLCIFIVAARVYL